MSGTVKAFGGRAVGWREGAGGSGFFAFASVCAHWCCERLCLCRGGLFLPFAWGVRGPLWRVGAFAWCGVRRYVGCEGRIVDVGIV